ncbi:MAG: hypothetical protein VX438_11405, partial [Planctomycetota bacterium]|nr:hypothetical protein [Planctomycetota bacterium]
QYRLPAQSLASSKLEKPGWGYIARHQDLLLGTVVRDDASSRKWWGKTKWYDATGGSDTHVVAGNALFAIDLKTNQPSWNYPGLILHPTITILENKIYFVEDKTPAHLAKPPGRIPLDQGQLHELVCLDLGDGSEIFRNPIDPFQGKLASLYLSGGGNPQLKSLVLVASETSRSEFTVSNFNLQNGKPNWKRAVKWEANHHGKHISRPAIENDILYVRPEVMKLSDGSTIHRGFPSGHGCSSYTLAKNGLFSRLGETTWWDVRNSKVNRFSRVRTDCWISAIPAQGMLLSAEGGGGCSCGSWLETSMGFLPRKIDQTFPELESPVPNTSPKQ